MVRASSYRCHVCFTMSINVSPSPVSVKIVKVYLDFLDSVTYAVKHRTVGGGLAAPRRSGGRPDRRRSRRIRPEDERTPDGQNGRSSLPPTGATVEAVPRNNGGE